MGLGGLFLFPTIARYKSMADAAAAECARLGQQTVPDETSPQDEGNRGIGPPRTGLDWEPFLDDLRPKAVESQIRQGDNFANKGDWEKAAKLYKQAARIDPNNELARQKAAQARQKVDDMHDLDHRADYYHPTQPPSEPPSQPETGNQPNVPASPTPPAQKPTQQPAKLPAKSPNAEGPEHQSPVEQKYNKINWGDPEKDSPLGQ